MPRFEGIIEEIRFRNEENGWTVAMLRYGKKRIAAVGVMPFLGRRGACRAFGRVG